MSLNQSMNITLGSLKNNQYALTVVAQNISNVHTEGYVRQKVNFATNEYTTDCENVISTIKGMNGARIDSLTDFIDDAKFNDLIGKNADAEYYNALADALGDLEDIADALGDNGLNSVLGDFYSAAADLEKYPANMGIRQQFVMAAQSVAEKFNDISKRYDSLKDEKAQKIEYSISDINDLFGNLAQANQSYINANGSPTAKNDINKVLQELSNYMDVKTEKNPNGTINLYLGNTKVVEAGKVKYNIDVTCDTSSDEVVSFKLIPTNDDDPVIENGVTEAFKAGTIKASIDFLNGTGNAYSTVNDMKNMLNNAAKAFATTVNEIQTYDTGDVFAASITTDAEGNLILEKASKAIFVTSDGGDEFNASNIQINSEVSKNPFYVAAARIDTTKYTDEENANEDWRKAIGNSDNASEFVAIQNAKICAYGDSPVNNCTLTDYLTYGATKVGSDAAHIANQADTCNDILNNAAADYSNLVGVNLDEELADMIKYQRAYEASAKLFSIIDSITVTIINMV